MKTETIQIRIDAQTKREARKILQSLGIDLSGAVKLFLHNVIHRQAIPLDLRTENGFTLEQEQTLLRETHQAKKSQESFATIDALMRDLND